MQTEGQSSRTAFAVGWAAGVATVIVLVLLLSQVAHVSIIIRT